MSQYSFVAAEILSANEGYNLVKLDGSGQIVRCTARADIAIGVVEGNSALVGDTAKVTMSNQDAEVANLIADEAIAVGEFVCPSTTAGRVLDADTTGDAIVGIAVTSTAAAGEPIKVKLFDYKGNLVA